MLGSIGDFLSKGADLVGNAGRQVLGGLESAQQVVRNIPRQIVSAGEDIERTYYGEPPANPQQQQPQQQGANNQTVLLAAGGIGILLVVLILKS